MLIVKRQLTGTLLLLTSLCVTSCGSGSNTRSIAAETYVIVPAEKSSLFTTYLASVVKKHGMVPNLGKATDDKGYSVYVLDATSPSVRLRSENVPLSGHEDPKQCGVYTEPHSDPGQYFIWVSPSTLTADTRDSRELLAKIVEDLEVNGYDVRKNPVKCSAQSKTASKG